MKRKRIKKNWTPECRAKNPSAKDVFETWHDFETRERVPVNMEPLSRELAVLGKAVAVAYRSDKWNEGEAKDYVHDFNQRDLPLMLYDPANNMLLIVGGKFKVKAEGLVG